MYDLLVMQVTQPFINLFAHIPYLCFADVLLLPLMLFNVVLQIALAGILHQNAKDHSVFRMKLRLALALDMNEFLVKE